MQRLGLALSGGGFRATLYHIGVVRLLRDAGVLPQITHITTVSGGSIFGAHLALNWDQYCGTSDDFDRAAEEVIRFVQLDVRNRIVRRFPLASTINVLRTMVRARPSRKFTRAGLLENHYEKYLFGDVPLSQLPDRPQLHILSTNISEGCLCSFNRNGLLRQRRAPGRRDRFERVHMGMATIPMAVAASSAFPGFFPPLELSGWDVGADEGEFTRQAFTDGGVYDNLGLRMFRCLEQNWTREIVQFRQEDFLHLDGIAAALTTALDLPEGTPIRRLREMIDTYAPPSDGEEQCPVGRVVGGLWEVVRSEELYRHPCFQGVELADQEAQSVFHQLIQRGRSSDLNSRIWINRQIIEAILKQVIGKPCFRLGSKGFDGIYVSDAGGKFKITREIRASGLIRTALRSSDILMDRVWQLESESFSNTPGVLFFPIRDVISRHQDHTALDPEIQRQTTRIRTDLDRFSEMEVSCLVKHGYCVARAALRNANGSDSEIPNGPPWEPASLRQRPSRNDEPSTETELQTARRLRNSSRRKIWSTLFGFTDWPSYVWLSLVVVILTIGPYLAYKTNQRANRQQMVINAITDMNSDYRRILKLLDSGPKKDFPPARFVNVSSLETPDFRGIEVRADTRIFDLRGWSDTTGETPAACYTRLRMIRTLESSDDGLVRLQRETQDDSVSFFCSTQSAKPRISRLQKPDGGYLWEVRLDLSRVPMNDLTEIDLQRTLPRELATSMSDGGRFNFTVVARTGLMEVWVLMPEDREYGGFQVSGYPLGDPELSELVVPHSTVALPTGSIVTFRLINPDAGYRYECSWNWTDDGLF